DLGPARGRVEDGLHLPGLLAVCVEQAAVLELDPGAPLTLGDEPDLDLCVDLRVVAPVGADLPVEHDPVGWFVGEYPSPVALAAVDAPLEPASAGAQLDDRRLRLGAADRLGLERPPGADLLGEDRE